MDIRFRAFSIVSRLAPDCSAANFNSLRVSTDTPVRLLILSSSSPRSAKFLIAPMAKPVIAAAPPMASPMAALRTAANALLAPFLNLPMRPSAFETALLSEAVLPVIRTTRFARVAMGVILHCETQKTTVKGSQFYYTVIAS